MKNSAQRNPEQDDLVIVVSRENFHLEAVGKTGYTLLLNFTGSNMQHKPESCLQLSGAQGRASEEIFSGFRDSHVETYSSCS